MKNIKTGKHTRVICAALGIFALIAIFSPGLYTILWPIFHTRQVTLAGSKFIVPDGWVTTPKRWESSFNSLTMMRLPTAVFGMHGNYPTIVIYQRSNAKVENSEALARWKAVAPGNFEARGYKIRSTKEFSSPKAIVCLELSSAAGNPESTCFFESNGLMADYYGDERAKDSLYNVIATAHF